MINPTAHTTRKTTPHPHTGLMTFVSAALLVCSLFSSAPANAISIELKDTAPDRIERQRKEPAGQIPLPGTPDVGQLDARLNDKGLKSGASMLIRIFKAESQLEVWMEKDGRFRHFATYPICQWSGSLGPKLTEGDKQAPEGFYTITRRQLHRRGRWRNSLNLGYPNVYDKSLIRTGSYILIHGGCSSVGCFAMTDPVMKEVYKLTKAALNKGQKHIPVHVFPFHMTAEALDKRAKHQWHGFWQNLKTGYDSFERTRQAPRINVCNGRYEVRDATPPEVGASRPLTACGQTAARAKAQELLESIVNHPSRWRSLSTADKAQLNAHIPRLTKLARNGKLKRQRKAKKASRRATLGKRHARRCNIGLASCRKYLALKQRRAARARNRRTTRTARR